MKPDIMQNESRATGTCFEKQFCIRALMASSFYDSTVICSTKKNTMSFHEMNTLEALNRHTEHQFKSISEFTQHLDELLLKKLLTE
ncbi:hypothetical protein [Paenisporosarcina indica]|uniref:hypothetical protein n=1 Tax=Paenisporosarcina indica TaxID=650093 RepID=UPI00094FF896|nr:hypothetical protein [Paenisporosarcina indica]